MVNVKLPAVLVAVVVIAGVAVLAYTTLGSITVENPYYRTLERPPRTRLGALRV